MVAKVDFYVFNFTRSAITELRFSAHSKAFLYAVQLQSNGKWQIPAACWFLRSISFLSSKQQSSERTFLQNRSTFPSRAGIERCFSSFRAPPVRPIFSRTKTAPSFGPEGTVYFPSWGPQHRQMLAGRHLWVRMRNRSIQSGIN